MILIFTNQYEIGISIDVLRQIIQFLRKYLYFLNLKDNMFCEFKLDFN